MTHLTTASLILGSMLASCSLQLVRNTHPKAAPSRTRVRITEPRINTYRAKVKLTVDICCLYIELLKYSMIYFTLNVNKSF